MEEKRPTIAVFDFDGTLTTHDTLLLFIRFVYGPWRMLLGFLRYAPLLVLMKLRLYPNGQAKEKVFGHFFQGMAYEQFVTYCEDFAKQYNGILRGSLLQILGQHQEQGHAIYIVTASVGEWVRPFLQDVEVVGTRVEIDAEGCLTGRFAGPNCYGSEKVRRLLDVIPSREKYYLVAYGDSRGDRELLALADEAYWVTNSEQVVCNEKARKHDETGTFLRFCIVGATATAIDALVFYIAIRYTIYPVALVLGYIISLIFNYFLTVLWTFHRHVTLRNAIGVVAAHLFNLFVVRMSLMWLFVSLLALPSRIAYLPTLALSVITNFLIIQFILKRIK